jgi:hypothetical protein
VAVVVEQEGGEGKVVLGRTVLKNLATEVGGTGAFGENSCHAEGPMCGRVCVPRWFVGSLVFVREDVD